MWWNKKEQPEREVEVKVNNFIPLEKSNAEVYTYSSAIVAAMAWLSKNIGEAELVSEYLDNDEWIDTNIPKEILYVHPNENFNFTHKLAATAQDIVLRGNGLWLKLYNDRQRLVGFQYIPWTDVTVDFSDNNAVIDFYTINEKKYRPKEVIHFRNGASLVNHNLGLDIWAALSLHNDVDTHVSVYYQSLIKSPSPKQILIVDREKIGKATVTQESLDRISNRLSASSKVGNAGSYPVLDIPLNAIPHGYNPKDLSIQEIVEFAENRICAVLGIPSQVLNLSAGANPTYSNFEEAQKIATVNFLVPVWRNISQTITEQAPELWLRESRLRFKYEDTESLAENKFNDSERIANLYKAGVIDRYTANVSLGLPVEDKDKGVYFNSQTGVN